MLEYAVVTVNRILNAVYSNMGQSSYVIPIDEDDPKRIAFDSWLNATGIDDEQVKDVNYATAFLRVYFFTLFECNSCICIPPILSEMGFGVTIEKSGIFSYNHNIENYCCGC